MSKNLLLMVFTLFILGLGYSQPVSITTAPQTNGATSGLRAPNGTSSHVYMKAVGLVLASELTGIAPGSTLTTFGYTLSSGASTTAPTGNYTLSLQNTSDVTYNKGTSYSVAIVGMTEVYAGTMTIPISATTTSVTVTLSTPFVYTGGGMYVAYEWYNPGPYSTTAAVYLCNNTLSPGLASAGSTVEVNTLGTTAFRPSFLFGIDNPYVNENSVESIDVPAGKVAVEINNTYTVASVIRNNSAVTATDIPVSLNITGANTFANTQTITSLAAGASTTIVFPAYTPSVTGTNSITLSIPTDELNTNNQKTFTQNVTCQDWSLNPPSGTYTAAIGFGTGSGIIASSYFNMNASSMTGVRIALSTDAASIGKNVWGVLLNSTGVILATTNTVNIAAPDQGTFKAMNFASTQSLTAGTSYYFGLAQSTGTVGYFPLGSYAQPNVPFMKYVTTSTVGGTPAPLTSNLGYFGMEGVFEPVVNITTNSGSICVGNSFTIAPSGVVTFTVSGGSAIVSPTANATYTVTGTNSNGCVSLAGVISSVTVNALPTITAMTNNTLLCTGQTATLTVAGSATSYTWNTSETTTSIVVNPTTTTTYTVDGMDGNGCLNTTTVTQDVDLCTGISSIAKAEGINIYPNPNNGLFYVELTTNSKISITSVLGKIIVNEEMSAGKHELDIHGQADGIYFVKVIQNNKQQIIKIIKK